TKCTNYKNSTLKSREKIYFLASWKFIGVLIGLLSINNEAAAQDFYWRGDPGDGVFLNPDSACSHVADFINDWNGNKNYTHLRAEYLQPWAYRCKMDVTDNRGVIVMADSYQGWAFRVGDSCPAGMKENIATGTCVNIKKQTGTPSKLSCVGNPIDVLTGNKFELEIDYENSGSILLFSRVYNSIDGLWVHNYSTRLEITDTEVLRVSADGAEAIFTVNGTNITSDVSDLGTLSRYGDAWRYVGSNNETFYYDMHGRLTRKIFKSGQQLQFSFNGDVTVVTDGLGGSLSFTEDAQHQPLTFIAPGMSIQYTYNTNNRLSQMSRTQSGITQQRKFHYEDTRNSSLLTGITDERGVRYATWTYDDQGRATSSRHADGAELTQVVYNADGTRKVTNEFGKSTLYRFVDTAGTKRVSAIEGEPSANCPASNSTFTYNDRGQVLTQTDAKGFITTYTYNDRGLETTRTQASGTPQARTTTTTWHATFNLPLTVTEGGQVTTYTYDSQGRQTSRTQTAL
ncbi:MAG: DUF6531 domain-containing protein, partial [Pseudomonas sp.]|uniref:DUF6531 domain-containing protein n=1 Tax=Pseudomonas sp. TaxID=306 RepID=UPI0030F283F2